MTPRRFTKPIPGQDYHHIQPNPVPPARTCPGDLHLQRSRAAVRLPWFDPRHRSRPRSFWAPWFG